MELDKRMIQLRIDIIERDLKEIEEISRLRKITYRDELALKYALLECIEACIDISNYIISVKGFRRPMDYKDIFTILEENNIIDRDLSQRLQNMVKFRNILVHKYAIVDMKIVLKIARKDIVDKEVYKRNIKAYSINISKIFTI
ncbi:MAG: DUF86 domain-containing protein [Thermoprotei archaeon]|nr:MAG: DUF86 domain-containing protein [Thermoprotei archaeon]